VQLPGIEPRFLRCPARIAVIMPTTNLLLEQHSVPTSIQQYLETETASVLCLLLTNRLKIYTLSLVVTQTNAENLSLYRVYTKEWCGFKSK
jgi:hypothetical protein